MSSKIILDFTLTKPGPKTSRKSFDNLGDSMQYKKIKKIDSSVANFSPSSRLGFAFHTVKNKSKDINFSSKLDLSSSFCKLSPFDCVGIMSFLNLSVSKYNILKKFLDLKGIKILVSYKKILEYKQLNIYLPLDIIENTVKTTLSAIFFNTLFSILNFSELSNQAPIKVFLKYGGDGMTDGSDYKIIKRLPDTCDNSTFVVSICFLLITQNDKIIFENPSPSSNLYLRPVRMYFKKETRDFIQGCFKELEEEIKELASCSFRFENKDFTLNSVFFPSMCDGKVINAIEEIGWSRKCYICSEQGDKLSKIKPSESSFTSIDIFKYGLQPLHILIRATEWVLKISYSLGSQGLSSSEQKEFLKNRQGIVHQRIVQGFGLNVDVPSIKNGRTTDGNMARKLFSDHIRFAHFLELDQEFISNIACLLACVSSHRKISAVRYLEVSCRVFTFFNENYSCVASITPNIHRLLCHGHQFFTYSNFASGVLSEQALESSHKCTKKYKTLAFSNSRENILRDVFNKFSVSSYPSISKIFNSLKSSSYKLFEEGLWANMVED